MFFLLNGLIAIVLIFYFGTWLLSNKTIAFIIPPYNSNTVVIEYEVKGRIYTNSHLRSDIPFDEKQIAIHYSVFNPSSSRINSFMGLYAEPLAWWLIFFMASAMLLLLPNTVFSKGTMFQLKKGFPWISMDEYFPEPGGYSGGEKKNSPPLKKPKGLDQSSGSSKISTLE